MTAINAYAQGRIGYILTDTAGYDVEGRYLRDIEKVAVIDGLGVAVAARGHEDACRWFAQEIGTRFNSFDEFVDGGQEALATFYSTVQEDLAESGTEDVDLVVVGWSAARSSMELYLLSSFDHRTRGVASGAPFQMVKHPYVIAPIVSEHLARRGVLANGALNGRPKDVLLAAIDGQRKQKVEVSFAEDDLFIIGGEAVLTIITPEGITRETVRKWHDAVGERIQPFDAQPDVSSRSTSGMNRQQRRAMERAERKTAGAHK